MNSLNKLYNGADRFNLNREKYLEAIIYAMLKKFPDGIELSSVIIHNYQGELKSEIDVFNNEHRQTMIYFLKPQDANK